MTYESIKNKVNIKVLSISDVGCVLNQVPFETIGDMAVVYSVGDEPALVTNELVNILGISEDQLKRDALLNSLKTKPVVIQNSIEFLCDMYGVPVVPVKGGESTYIATVPDKEFGACVLAYPGFFDMAAAVIGGDYFLIPSSVHEVIITADIDNFDIERMKRDIYTTNREQSDASFLPLSDELYHYDAKECKFETADEYLLRCKKRNERKTLDGSRRPFEFQPANPASAQLREEVREKLRQIELAESLERMNWLTSGESEELLQQSAERMKSRKTSSQNVSESFPHDGK